MLLARLFMNVSLAEIGFVGIARKKTWGNAQLAEFACKNIHCIEVGHLKNYCFKLISFIKDGQSTICNNHYLQS